MKDTPTASKGEATGNAPVAIKKYANRRLYDTGSSSYVTLENLATMVREGHEFIVTDAKSGEDITRSVLAQIIFDMESKGSSLLPTSFLRQLIRYYGDTMQSLLPSYLEATMNAFSDNQSAYREQMHRLFGADSVNLTGAASFSEIARSNMDWFGAALRMMSRQSPAGDEPGEPGAAPARPTEDPETARAPSAARLSPEIEAMQRQLAEMQRQIQKLSAER